MLSAVSTLFVETKSKHVSTERGFDFAPLRSATLSLTCFLLWVNTWFIGAHPL